MPARLVLATIAAFALGLALMVPFEAVLTRVAGVLALFAYIVLGVFAIASPERLRSTGEPDRDPGAGRHPAGPDPSGPDSSGSKL